MIALLLLRKKSESKIPDALLLMDSIQAPERILLCLSRPCEMLRQLTEPSLVFQR